MEYKDETDENPLKGREYKLNLDPSFTKQMVSDRTKSRWDVRAKTSKMEDLMQVSQSSKRLVTDVEFQEPDEFLEPSYEDILTDMESEPFTDSTEDVADLMEEDTSVKGMRNFGTDESTAMVCDEEESNPIDTKRKRKEKDNEEYEFLEAEGEEEVHSHLLQEKMVMFDKSNITVGDVAEMISALSARFNLTSETRIKIFEMLKICAGPEFINLKISNYMFSKVYDPPEEKITLHYYCLKCTAKLLITKRKPFASDNCKVLICEKCSHQHQVSLNSPNYYQIIDLKYQVEQTLKNSEVSRELVNKVISRNTQNQKDKISDVDDGELHRKIIEKHPNAVTYNVATDGATAKNPLKCKLGFWPIQLLFNELPLSSRFKFIILAGIMMLSHEPSPALLNLFLESFVVEALALSSIDMPVTVDGVTYYLKFIPLISSVDSPARALMQNRLKFNGCYGCSFCYARGEYANNAIRYPTAVIDSPLRSNESHEKDVEISMTCKSLLKSHGVKGTSAMSSLPYFDMVWSFCFDYLHTVLFGPVENFITVDSNFSRSVIRKLDKRLLAIQPSHEVFKLPQKLSDKSVWKGSDWKSWLLFFSLPMCLDLLPINVLRNYALLVKSLYTLLKLEISEEELNQCDIDLRRFVHVYEELYGVGHMTFNVHMIVHITQCVRYTGPLAFNSTFPFEGNIGFIKNLITATKGVGLQICMRSMQFMSYKCQTRNFATSPIAKVFSDSLFTDKKVTLSAEIKMGVTLFGKPTLSNDADTAGAKIYSKCIYKRQTYHSVDYNRASKFNDTIVQLECGSIAQILEIIDMPDDTDIRLRVWKLDSKNMVVGDLEIPHIWEIVGIVDKIMVPLQTVRSKIIFLQFENKNYACKPPNCIETS